MHWTFVIAGYAVVLGGIAVYSFWVLARGRDLMSEVPPERQRFLD